jgi:hypothetical protein
VYSPGYGRLISAGRDGLTLVWDPRSVGTAAKRAKRARKHKSVSRARVTQRSVVVRRGFAASPQRRGLGAQSLGAGGGTAGGGMNAALCDTSDRDSHWPHRHGGHGKPIVPVDEVGPRLFVGFRVIDLLILEVHVARCCNNMRRAVCNMFCDATCCMCLRCSVLYGLCDATCCAMQRAVCCNMLCDATCCMLYAFASE